VLSPIIVILEDCFGICPNVIPTTKNRARVSIVFIVFLEISVKYKEVNCLQYEKALTEIQSGTKKSIKSLEESRNALGNLLDSIGLDCKVEFIDFDDTNKTIQIIN
jgi:hypothetical protein